MSQAAIASTPMGSSLVNPDGTTNRIWLQSYAKGVPGDVDISRYQSLNQYFDDCVNKYRERTAFISTRTDMSYGRVGKLVKAFAGWLQSQGVRKGDRVAIMLPNSFQYPVCLFGVLRVGAIVVNVNPLYTARELNHQLKDSGAETIIVMENFAKTLQDALPGTKVKRVVLTQLGDLLSDSINVKGRLINLAIRKFTDMVPAYSLPEARWLRDVLKDGSRVVVKSVPVKREDLAFLQYTGGTTGVSKGAMLTHGNVLANCLQAYAFIEPQLNGEVETIVTLIPLYHVFSLTVNCLIFMRLGGRNIMVANPRNIKLVLMALKGQAFTAITGVNTMFAALLDSPEFCKRNFSNLKLAQAGGMALHRSVAERWHAVTGNALVEGYGLTECSPIVSTFPMDLDSPPPPFTGTIGVPLPSTEVRIRREDGSWGEINEAGELCVRGPQVMQGYWQRSDETIKVIDKEGWLATGDVAVIDEKGYMKLVDRKKDMILVSGFNVYPNEIEDVIAMHPNVREVAAIGLPDDVAGERVKVIIVPRSPGLTKEEIVDHCRKSLTGYKIPRIVEFRDTELPKSPVGKILRRELRDGQ